MKTFHTWAGFFEDVGGLWPRVRSLAFAGVPVVLVEIRAEGERTHTLDQAFLTMVPGRGAEELRRWLEWAEGALPMPFEGFVVVEIGGAGDPEPSEEEHDVAVGRLRDRRRTLNEQELRQELHRERRFNAQLQKQSLRVVQQAPEVLNAAASVVWALGGTLRRSGAPAPRKQTLGQGAAKLVEGLACGVRGEGRKSAPPSTSSPVGEPVASPSELRQRLRTAEAWAASTDDERLGRVFAPVRAWLDQPTSDIADLRRLHGRAVVAIEAELEQDDRSAVLHRARELLTNQVADGPPANESSTAARRSKCRVRRRPPASASEGRRTPQAAEPSLDIRELELPKVLSSVAQHACPSCRDALLEAGHRLETEGLGEARGVERVRSAANAMTSLMGASDTCGVGCMWNTRRDTPGPLGVALGLLDVFIGSAGGQTLLAEVGAPVDPTKHRVEGPLAGDDRYVIVKTTEVGWLAAGKRRRPAAALGLPVLVSSDSFPGLGPAVAALVAQAPEDARTKLHELGRTLVDAAHQPPREACVQSHRVLLELTVHAPHWAQRLRSVAMLRALAVQVIDEAGGELIEPAFEDDVNRWQHEVVDGDREFVAALLCPGLRLEDEVLVKAQVSTCFDSDE